MARLFPRYICETLDDSTLKTVAGIRLADRETWYDLHNDAAAFDADEDYRECMATLAYRRILADDSDPIDAEA